jgi:hypothetical protein
MTIYNNTNAKRPDSIGTHNTEQSLGMGNAWMQPLTDETRNNDSSLTRRTALDDSSVSEVSSFKARNESFGINRQSSNQENMTASSIPPFNTGHLTSLQRSPVTTSDIGHDRSFKSGLHTFRDWTRLYLFGYKHDIVTPQIPRPS